MDVFVLVAFVAFFAMVLAWMAAPSSSKLQVMVAEPATAGAAD